MKLEINQLTKSYSKGKKALDSFTLTLEKGVYGILGPNGAGKSTLINCVTGIIKPDSGSIAFTDGNSHDYMSRLGFLPQNQDFYPNFTARELILYSMALKNVKVDNPKAYADGILKRVNLYDDRNKKVGAHSGGMKQRLGIAQALVGEPKVVIFDEPTAGLDPKERISIRNYIAELSKDKIILFATHVVSDIECIADKVLLLKSGEIIATGTPVELIESMAGKVGEITCTLDEVGELQKEYKIGNIRQRKNGLALRVVGDELPEEAVKVGDNIDLEDVYLYYFE